jgi:hypothetical protein
MRPKYPDAGIGLRPDHYSHLLDRPLTKVGWFEAISENYMDSYGRPMFVLEKIRADYPVALHGVSMSVASANGLDPDYLKRLRVLIERIDPFLVSDHLCWNRIDNRSHHDLLPFPFTGEALRIVCENIDRAQSALGRQVLIENVTSYLTFRGSEMSEWDFLRESSERSGCAILLDINNIYVNSINHRFDAKTFIDAIPAERVKQLHLAGYTEEEGFLFDTHSRAVHKPVWDLYAYASLKFQNAPVLIEWDQDIPAFERVEAEAVRASLLRKSAIAEDQHHNQRQPVIIEDGATPISA